MFEMEFMDMDRAPMDKVLETLRCDTNGLSTKDAEQRLALFGPNKFKDIQESKIEKFFRFMWNPFSCVMGVTAIMALVLANGGGKPRDWQDFVGIIVLLLINSTNGFIEDKKARIASDALLAHLELQTKVLRDGKWVKNDASILVPGDIIRIMTGDKIPADCRLLEGDPMKIDQYILTRESLPVTKHSGDLVYYGTICTEGEIEALVIHTGVHTLFGNVNPLVNLTNQEDGRLQKALNVVENFCICFILMGLFVEMMGMGPYQDRGYRVIVDNLLVLLIGGVPIAMPTAFSVLMATGSHRLSQQGVITKRMAVIEEIGSMDVLFIDRTGALTMNKLSVDRDFIEAFAESVELDDVVLMAARASRVENKDAIDEAIVGMLKDPKEARVGIQEIHFLPFNQTDRRTTLTYIDNDGKMHRVSKGAPEKILNLVDNKAEIERRVHSVIDKYAEQGLLSIAVAYQEVPEGTKESLGDPWQLIGLIPLLDPPRHDSAETIKKAVNLGVNVKMITGDQLAIAKETGRRLGLGTNMYPASPLLADYKYYNLIDVADGFSSVFPEQRNEIVNHLQDKLLICGITGDGADDVPALMRADIGIAVADATDAARIASNIVLTKPGPSGIISVILTSRTISQTMKNCAVYAVSNTVGIVLGFLLITVIWEFDFPPFMALIIAIINNSSMMTIVKDRVKPSPQPDRWKIAEIFTTGIVIGGYLATMTVFFFWAAYQTDFFPRTFNVTSLHKKDFKMLASAVFLQVCTISQALIFVTRSRAEHHTEPLLMLDSAVSQMIAMLIAVYANWGFASVKGIGWRWAGVIWLYNLICYIPLVPLKLFIRYTLSERKEKFEIEEPQRRWAHALRILHGRDTYETGFTEYHNDKIQQREDEDDVATDDELLIFFHISEFLIPICIFKHQKKLKLYFSRNHFYHTESLTFLKA